MRFGAHESIAGGLQHAVGRGEQDGCEALQVFTTFNTRWAARALSDEEASLFRSEAARVGWPLLAHAHYLINLASPDAQLWRRSGAALAEEVERCEQLGVDAVVVHPGAHVGSGERCGLARAARALGEVLRRCAGFTTRVLVENTAGQGSVLGYALPQLGWLLEHTRGGERLGVCFDTCHAWAAGYDLRRPAGYRATIEALRREVGLETVRAFHLNDARGALGSRRDRHASVGEGQIGLRGFARLVNEPCFADTPAVVETPPDADGQSSFARNIQTLKSLRRRQRAASGSS